MLLKKEKVTIVLVEFSKWAAYRGMSDNYIRRLLTKWVAYKGNKRNK